MSTALHSRSRGDYYIQTCATSNKLDATRALLHQTASETDQALRLEGSHFPASFDGPAEP